MTPEELKKFVESKGYDHVKITVFKSGKFQVRYWEPDFKNLRKCHFLLSELPSKFDGTEKAFWLENSFPSLYSEPQIAKSTRANQ